MCVLTLLLLSPEGIANSSLFNFNFKVSPKVPKEWKKTFCKMFHSFISLMWSVKTQIQCFHIQKLCSTIHCRYISEMF